jgi:hypothetical protein
MTSERTIEELLGYTTERLIALTPEELATWVGDSITRQEELLAKLPKVRAAGSPRVNQGAVRKEVKAAQNLAALPPELQAIAAQAQALLKGLKGR